MKKILIIDDSALMRRVMSDIINTDPVLQVADMAVNGVEGLTLLQQGNTYDLILLDINMPKMDGVAFMENLSDKKISAKVIVVSSIASRSANETIRALELGAFDFIRKPDSYIGSENSEFKSQLLAKIYVAVGLELNTEPIDWNKLKSLAKRKPAKKPVKKLLPPILSHAKETSGKLVFIASSTGGPRTLQQVIPFIPKDFPYPIVIVQHMPQGFTKSLANRLDEMSQLEVVETEDGQILEAGKVYIAAGGYQSYLVQTEKDEYRFRVTEDPPRNALRPCADVFLESLAESAFKEIICVVLTGMGDDATRGLAYLRQYKNLKVIAQDKETCVVYGMPRAAEAAGLVDEMVALPDMAEAIIKQIK